MTESVVFEWETISNCTHNAFLLSYIKLPTETRIMKQRDEQPISLFSFTNWNHQFLKFLKETQQRSTLEFVCPLSRIARVKWLPAKWTKVVQGTGAIGDPRPADWTVFYCHRARKIDPSHRTILLRGTRGTVERGKRKRTRKKRAARGQGKLRKTGVQSVCNCKQG